MSHSSANAPEPQSNSCCCGGSQSRVSGPEWEHVGHAECSDVLHRIYEYLDGEMGPVDVARVAVHLEECGPCLAEHDLDRAIKAAVQRANQAQACPEQLRVKVVQRITMMRLTLEE